MSFLVHFHECAKKTAVSVLSFEAHLVAENSKCGPRRLNFAFFCTVARSFFSSYRTDRRNARGVVRVHTRYQCRKITPCSLAALSKNTASLQ